MLNIRPQGPFFFTETNITITVEYAYRSRNSINYGRNGLETSLVETNKFSGEIKD
jgi:hypothetical protein